MWRLVLAEQIQPLRRDDSFVGVGGVPSQRSIKFLEQLRLNSNNSELEIEQQIIAIVGTTVTPQLNSLLAENYASSNEIVDLNSLIVQLTATIGQQQAVVESNIIEIEELKGLVLQLSNSYEKSLISNLQKKVSDLEARINVI
jgi:hypothetical protein